MLEGLKSDIFAMNKVNLGSTLFCTNSELDGSKPEVKKTLADKRLNDVPPAIGREYAEMSTVLTLRL
jgi:hypothetical protein